MRLVQKERKIPEWKVQVVEELSNLMKAYPVIAIANLAGVSAGLLQKIRKIIKQLYDDDIVITVAKNNLFRLAAKRAGLKGREKLEPLLTGQRLFIFSRLNPFELYAIFERTKIPVPAKPGMVVDREIIVPAGDTGIPPGPILSSFGKLRIPTRVQGGTIWIAKDTRVAKPGDVISADLAAMLQRLGIYPVEAGIEIEAVLEDGNLMRKEDLKLDIDEYKSMIAEAFRNAIALGSDIALPVPDVLEQSLIKAHTRAVRVAAEAGLVLPGLEEDVIAWAVQKAYAIVYALGEKAKELGIEAPAAPVEAKPVEERKEEKEEAKEEEEEEEKKELSEEDLASGLGALFG